MNDIHRPFLSFGKLPEIKADVVWMEPGNGI